MGPTALASAVHGGHTRDRVATFDRIAVVLALVLAPGCLGPSTDDDDDDGGDVGGEDIAGDDHGDEVPDLAYCDSVADWDPAWGALEEQILVIVNEHRAAGADCRSGGMFAPTTPLTMNRSLRCSARKHSQDMAARDFFDHTNPSGEDPFVRMQQAGYDYSAAGENIAAGSPDAAGTMMQWMNSDGHCTNIMNPGFVDIGVGYSTGGQFGTLWTQNFGAPL